MSGKPSPEDEDLWTGYIREQIAKVWQREEKRREREEEQLARAGRRRRAPDAIGLDRIAPLAQRSILSDELLRLGPNVIGGSGGSGTRVVARSAERAGRLT